MPTHREMTFVVLGEMLIDILGHDELHHRVAKELHPLVVTPV